MIKINIKESLKLNGERSAFISFPYNPELVGFIRNLPTRNWDPDSKLWEIPLNKIDSIIFNFMSLGIEIKELVDSEKIEILTLPEGFEFKTNPYSYQKDGVLYGLNKDRFLLGDEQGLGKTKQIIDLALAHRAKKPYKHCLIICGVNSLKWNWEHEISIHSNESAFIIGSKMNKKGRKVVGSNEDKLNSLKNLPDDFFIITNKESLRYSVKDPKTKKETFPITEQIQRLADSGEIGFIAFDEIHKSKNPTSAEGENLLKISAEKMVAMTGTPVMNKPLDLFLPLKWLGYEKHTWSAFRNHHAVFDGFSSITGYKNLSELQEMLDQVMLRRLKVDVLDLPEKIYIDDYVEMGSKQWKVYDEVRELILKDIDKVKIIPHPMVVTQRLRQATGTTEILSTSVKESAKFERLAEIAEDLRENNQKCIVFSNWTMITDPAYEKMSELGFNPAIYTGKLNDNQRRQEIKKFKEDPTCTMIIGTVKALGTGLTLTEASTVIFLDEPWTNADKEQAIDRCHRIGAKNNINIYTMMCKDTIDERVNNLVRGKGKMAGALVDGEIPSERLDEVISYLLG